MAFYNFLLDPVEVPRVDTKHRKINSEIPAPGTKEILSRLDRVESRSMHGQLPIVWDKAEGFNVYDKLGNCWIDFTSGIFFSNVGHSNQRVSKALKKSTLCNLNKSCSHPHCNKKYKKSCHKS